MAPMRRERPLGARGPQGRLAAAHGRMRLPILRFAGATAGLGRGPSPAIAECPSGGVRRESSADVDVADDGTELDWSGHSRQPVSSMLVEAMAGRRDAATATVNCSIRAVRRGGTL